MSKSIKSVDSFHFFHKYINLQKIQVSITIEARWIPRQLKTNLEKFLKRLC